MSRQASGMVFSIRNHGRPASRLANGNSAMHHLKLVFVAAAILGSCVSILRAESMLAPNAGDFSLETASPAPVAPPSDIAASPSATATPPVVVVSRAVEVAARRDADQPQEQMRDPAPSADHPAVLGGRALSRHTRLRHSCAHRLARLHKRAAQARGPRARAPAWVAAPIMPQCSHCWQLVLLGVGY